MDYLPINALSAVILVAGKVESEDEEWIGPKVPVVLYRQVPPPASTLDDDYTKEEKLNFYDVCPPYPDPPFELPLPAGLTLHVSLGKLLSEGRTGMIFECECTIPHGNEKGYKIPPVVIKLARQFHTKDISREATAYESITCLQGSAVPRCYGFFQARLFDYFDFGPMSLLVIEKLGGLLELGKPLPNGVESDLNDVGSDLAKLHILHSDLRWENILSVLPPSEGGLPSLPSPFTGKIYGWRLVDFDLAKRTTHHITFAQGHYIGHMERVLSCIPMGIPVQPWE
ncbi:hypothetical protein EV368DRAFT_67889 [Lentinula lateritia]|nr:hypothetical protein EV368DRAFT_67889 [Lentinula lateritia]